MHDISVTPVPNGAILTIRWDSEPERIYLIPLGTGDLIAQYQLDVWITQLDLNLDDAGSWRANATRIGVDTYLAVLPTRGSS
ncbi:hypothetical protein [Gordonia polyisoprenivorans]|uniref:Uncharacterized protein n=2 Tax=Gordonia polyisoprenivorans TaxID=84595 RepID=A0A846WFN6_9ACTN|nr:hypothetical protein [Gordonia polyisoprenivorans]NKY00605.1 hypothetical protein [Gordonia polyisoprenivorans]